jgi:hypothetical protein
MSKITSMVVVKYKIITPEFCKIFSIAHISQGSVAGDNSHVRQVPMGNLFFTLSLRAEIKLK